MPIYRKSRTAAQAFTGADADTGLFDPDNKTSSLFQTRCNSVTFVTPGTAVAFTVSKVDPDNAANEVLIFSGTGQNFEYEDILLAVEADGDSWHLKVTTGTLDDVGWLTIDHDEESTES